MSSNLACIYHFNPTCEYAVANGKPSWQPNQLLQKMETDLATLPMFFAKGKDFVLVDKQPSEIFLSSFKKLEIELPGFIKKAELSGEIFQNLSIDKLIPWGWSPSAHKLLTPLKNSCSEQFKKSPVFNWNPDYKSYYAKKFALKMLEQLLLYYPDKDFISEKNIGGVCRNLHEVEILLKKWEKIMVKTPWGSSGRGLQPVTKTPVHKKVWEKISGILTSQGYAIVEPFLVKVMDLAFQFELIKGNACFLGISYFSADKHGQYIGNYLNGMVLLPPEVPERFVQETTEKIIPRLKHCIENSELALNYEGNIGVDALIFMNKNGELKINPCLEINLRKNMGLLSFYLEELLAHGRKGMFKSYYNKGIPFIQFKEEMQKKHPLKIQNNRIDSGFFALTEANPETIFGAYVLV